MALALMQPIDAIILEKTYNSSDTGRSDVTVAANNYADVTIPTISGHKVLSYFATFSGTGVSVNSTISAASSQTTVRIVNKGSQSYTWGYSIKVFYVPTDYTTT